MAISVVDREEKPWEKGKKSWLPAFSAFPSLFSKFSSLSFLNKQQNLAMTKLKAFADDKFSVAYMMISVFDRVENILGKGENAGYQHFLLFPKCFQKPLSLTLYSIDTHFDTSTAEILENILGKGEIAT